MEYSSEKYINKENISYVVIGYFLKKIPWRKYSQRRFSGNDIFKEPIVLSKRRYAAENVS